MKFNTTQYTTLYQEGTTEKTKVANTDHPTSPVDILIKETDP